MSQLINFAELDIADAPDAKFSLIHRNYVIGCDPFDQEEGSEMSVFNVYDTTAGRIVMKVKTKRDFNWFENFVTKVDVVKNYIVSTKFINDAGRAKKPSEIRAEYSRTQGNITAQC